MIEPKPYFKGIEKKLIEMIEESNNSIKIAMAWFTNVDIKNSLIQKKISNPNIEIIIVVDENEINEKYFMNSKPIFDDVGIQIRKNIASRFLHNKFMVIDENITITGSYNYSKKANVNLENIVVIECSKFSSNYCRIFEFLTNSDYVDENIKFLFENLRFAQELLSAYYPFNKQEYLKYKDKIEMGDCFTHENGLFNEIKYYPGFIFNSKISHIKNIESNFEFSLPIKKNMIKSWIKSRNENLIIDSFKEFEDEHHLINDELENNELGVKNYFKRKIENTYRYSELKAMIEKDINIILEDDLWLNNFEPFISKKIVEEIFSKILVVKKQRRQVFNPYLPDCES